MRLVQKSCKPTLTNLIFFKKLTCHKKTLTFRRMSNQCKTFSMIITHANLYFYSFLPWKKDENFPRLASSFFMHFRISQLTPAVQSHNEKRSIFKHFRDVHDMESQILITHESRGKLGIEGSSSFLCLFIISFSQRCPKIALKFPTPGSLSLLGSSVFPK